MSKIPNDNSRSERRRRRQKQRQQQQAEVAAPAHSNIATKRREKRRKENIKCGIYWESSTKKTEEGRQAGTHTLIEVEEKRIKSFSLLFISTISAEQCVYCVYTYTNGVIYLLNVLVQNKTFEIFSNNKMKANQRKNEKERRRDREKEKKKRIKRYRQNKKT